MYKRFTKPKVEKEQVIIPCHYCSKPSTCKTGEIYFCSSNECAVKWWGKDKANQN